MADLLDRLTDAIGNRYAIEEELGAGRHVDEYRIMNIEQGILNGRGALRDWIFSVRYSIFN